MYKWFKSLFGCGKNSLDGKNGIDGKDGKNGIDGKNGLDGKDGKNGTDGKDGLDGKNGIDGQNGLDGKNGLDGQNGLDGKNGLDGRDGTDGKNGIDGLDGKNGIDGKNGLDGNDGKNGADGKNGIDGKDGINGKDGIDVNTWIRTLYFNNGNSIIDLKPNFLSNKVIFSHNGQGLIAVSEPTDNGGKIVVNSDEWTLSNTGFNNSKETATFISNLIQYFIGDKKGKFHAISTNFGLVESSLESTMIAMGHTFTKGKNIKIDLPTISNYDAIFVAGDEVDNQVLIQYVKNGGKVYLAAGTGWGGAEAEANRWNKFLGEFNLKFSGVYNGISGNISPNQSHPLFKGIVPSLDGIQKTIEDLNTRLKTLEASHKDLSEKHTRLIFNLGNHDKQFVKWDEVG